MVALNQGSSGQARADQANQTRQTSRSGRFGGGMPVPRPRGSTPPRRARRSRRPRRSWLARWLPKPGAVSGWFYRALAVIGFAIVVGLAPALLPIASIGLFLALGSAVMRPRYLLLDAGLVGVAVLFVLSLTSEPAWSSVPVGLILVGAMLIGWLLRRERAVAAVGGAAAADAMLIDLRNQVLIRSANPVLPAGWLFETDLRSAHGESFSGDFVVTASSASEDPDHLDVVLVDVSGNGQVAGARALLMAGALEALLDSVPREQFLPAANQHVLRHADDEGFATAIHVSLDLVTGNFTLSGAGHPPAAHFRAGSGRWEVRDGEQGPALGLLPGAVYPTISGRLLHGDALLLYTDGLVESRRLDVHRGIDRLIGHADPLLARGVNPAAARITEAIRAEEGDDRALVVIRRGRGS
jgi:hypothetical protein